MQERIQKPEITHTITFLGKLKKDFKLQGIHFDSQTQILNLRDKLVHWYRINRGETKGKYLERIQRQDSQYETIRDSLIMLWQKEEGTNNWSYPSQRVKFLNKNGGGDRMLVEHLLQFHDRENSRISNQLEKQKLKDLPGLQVIHETAGGYKLFKVVGDRDVREKVFQQVTGEMGNCLGGTHLSEYLEKTESNSEIYLMCEAGKFIVAMEYDIQSRTVKQIESNKKVYGTKAVTEQTVSLSDFFENILAFVKQVKPKSILGLNHLENKGMLINKVITMEGEIVAKDTVSESEILFPIPIFGPAETIKFPETKSKTPVKEFFKPRSHKKSIEAGISQWSEIFKEIEIEVQAKPPTSVKSMDLQKTANDNQILNRLGIVVGPNGEITPETDQSKLFTFEEIQTLMEQQMEILDGKIKEGPLLTNGHANFFHVKGVDNKVRSFACLWYFDSAQWDVDSRIFGGVWYDGYRFFSRN